MACKFLDWVSVSEDVIICPFIQNLMFDHPFFLNVLMRSQEPIDSHIARHVGMGSAIDFEVLHLR